MTCMYCGKMIGSNKQEVCKICQARRIVRDKDLIYQDALKELDEAKHTLIDLLTKEPK